MLYLGSWWQRTSAARAHEHTALLQRLSASIACSSWALQEAACARLQLLNSSYLLDVISLIVLTHTAMLSAEQLAEVYLASWPHLPSASRLLQAVAAVWGRRLGEH